MVRMVHMLLLPRLMTAFLDPIDDIHDFTELPDLPDDDDPFWKDEDGEGELDDNWDGEPDETISSESSKTLSSTGTAAKRAFSEVEGEETEGETPRPKITTPGMRHFLLVLTTSLTVTEQINGRGWSTNTYQFENPGGLQILFHLVLGEELAAHP